MKPNAIKVAGEVYLLIESGQAVEAAKSLYGAKCNAKTCKDEYCDLVHYHLPTCQCEGCRS